MRKSFLKSAFEIEKGLKTLARCAALAALLCVPAAAQSQEPQAPEPVAPAPASPQPAAPSYVVASDEEYRIGISDVLEIKVADAPELSGSYRVAASGAFTMPYVGRVAAEGRTAEEVRRLIEDGLRGRYLKDPQVTVTVAQINSRSFFIQGAVQRPGLYLIEGKPTLLALITIAGGLAPNHGSTAFIIREERNGAAQDGEPGYKLIKANIAGLLKGRFDQNVQIEPRDIINIPQTDVFFVGGEVNAPGSFPLKEGTTLRQAIALSQGTTFKAALGRGMIFREDSDGKRLEIPVHIGEVMTGKQPDIPIQANDIIIVPNSRMKSISSALLSAFGMGVVRSPIR